MQQAQLQLALPGSWHAIDLASPEATKSSIKRLATEVGGTSDEGAPARILLREQISQAVGSAEGAQPAAMYFGNELVPGVALPVSITVYQPQSLRLTPAVGTDPDQVLNILRRGLEKDHEEIHEVTGRNFKGLRTVLREHQDPPAPDSSDPTVAEAMKHPAYQALNDPSVRAEADGIEVTNLRVDYWCHQPFTKNAIIVSFSTGLSAIEQTVLRLFDTIVELAYFTAPEDQDQA